MNGVCDETTPGTDLARSDGGHVYAGVPGTPTNMRECLLADREERIAASAQTQVMTPGEQTMLRTMEAMQDLMLSQSAQLARLENMLREMVVLTGGQETEIKRAAIERARELCATYEMPPKMYTKIAALIRADVVRPSGVRAVRDIPRCEFQTALSQAREWDRPGTMRRLARETRARQGG